MIEFLFVPDINECNDSSIHNCEQLCNNTLGSFHCMCFDGYELNDDNTTCYGQPTFLCYACPCSSPLIFFTHYYCTDVDECATGVNECDQHCHNSIGAYTCSCNNTYTLNIDGFHCDGML